MRLGVLDIGSNTVHLLLVDAHPGAQPVPFASHKRPLSLVQYLDGDGNINDAGQLELVDFVLEAWEFAAKHKAEDLLAFCTSAIREAGNGEAVLARVQHETTVAPQELSGREEAAMTFFAVRRWYGWGAGTILDLDIGGGSFEMALGADELPELAISVPLGARPADAGLAAGGPAHRQKREGATPVHPRYAEGTGEEVRQTRPRPTWWPGPPRRSVRWRASPAQLRVPWAPMSSGNCFCPTLGCGPSGSRAMSAADRLYLPGVSEARAQQFLAGALVAEAALEMFKVPACRSAPGRCGRD